MAIEIICWDQPLGVEHVDDGCGRYVYTPVARDVENRAVYFVMAALTPFSDDGPEYSFAVVCRDVDTEEEVEFLSGLETRDLFNAEERILLRMAVLMVTMELLLWARPERVYRTTHDVSPPDKALDKHYIVSSVFARAGYQVTQSDSWHGKRAWIMELNTQSERPPLDSVDAMA